MKKFLLYCTIVYPLYLLTKFLLTKLFKGLHFILVGWWWNKLFLKKSIPEVEEILSKGKTVGRHLSMLAWLQREGANKGHISASDIKMIAKKHKVSYKYLRTSFLTAINANEYLWATWGKKYI